MSPAPEAARSTIDGRIASSLKRLRTSTQLPLTFAGIVADAPGRSATSTITLRQFDGANSGAMLGVKLELGFGLGGQVVALNRPIATEDYLTAGRIRHRYDRFVEAEGLHGMIAAPVIVDRHPVAVLYASSRRVELFGPRALDVIVHEARALEQRLAIDAFVADRSARTSATEAESDQDALLTMIAEMRALAASTTDDVTREALIRACAKAEGCVESQGGAAVLTAREREVLSLVALGQRNAEISDALGLTLNTVKSYLRSVMQKLDADTRYQAVLTARRLRVLA